MNRDTLLLTFAILVMIVALAGAGKPAVKKLSDLLTNPVKKIQVEQVMAVRRGN